MTAASSPPPRDGEVLRRCYMGLEHTQGACGTACPAAPSEPPAADSPTPGTETCRCPADDTGSAIEYETCEACFLPYAAPSPVDATEPPAEACDACLLPHGPFCADNGCARRPEPSAETQQGDERDRVIEALIDADGAYFVRDMDGPGYFEVMADAALAARPSADTETLRRVRELVDDVVKLQWEHNAPQVQQLRAKLESLLAALDAR